MGIWDWLFDKPKEEKKKTNIFTEYNPATKVNMEDKIAHEIKYLLLDKVFTVNIMESEINKVLREKSDEYSLIRKKCRELERMIKKEFKDKLDIRYDINHFPPVHVYNYNSTKEILDSVLVKIREQLDYFTKIHISYSTLQNTFNINGVQFVKRNSLYGDIVYSIENSRYNLTILKIKGMIINPFTESEGSKLKTSFEDLLKKNKTHLIRQFFDNLNTDVVLLENVVNARCKDEYKGYKIEVDKEDFIYSEEIHIKVYKEVGDDFYEYSHSRRIGKESFVKKIKSKESIDNLFYNTKNGILTK